MTRRRPAVHFTPDHGWMNDPHGLVYANGEYHAFFQYVPHDTKWQSDLHWGHAVSRDAVRWTDRGSALRGSRMVVPNSHRVAAKHWHEP